MKLTETDSQDVFTTETAGLANAPGPIPSGFPPRPRRLPPSPSST
jgi:hypothetical protein